MAWRYGWRPSLPDHRDHQADVTGLKTKAEVDPRGKLPPVYDQGQLGSCTANAVAAAVEYDRILDGHPKIARRSRLFLYYCERKLEGSLSQGDVGAYGRDGFKAAQKWGIPTENDWPYIIERFSINPPPEAWDHAAQHLLTRTYASVPRDRESIKRALSNDQTVAFGFSVYESFESDKVANTGIVPLPGRHEQLLGGHEVLAVGYLKSKPDYALCRNSWGTSWGISGYFLMPWEYIENPGLTDDLRTIVRPLGK